MGSSVVILKDSIRAKITAQILKYYCLKHFVFVAELSCCHQRISGVFPINQWYFEEWNAIPQALVTRKVDINEEM